MLAGEMRAFVEDVAAEVAALSGKPVAEHVGDVTRDAANLVAAVLSADGRFTDDELRAYATDVGPLLEPPLIVTPTQLRETRVLENSATWLSGVSPLLDLLIGADRRSGTRRSHVYYERALRLSHVVAAIDLVASPAELSAIDAFRTLVLQAMDAAGVPRPGRTTSADHSPVTPSNGATAAATPPVASTAPVEDLPAARPIEELLAELDALIGLEAVKSEVRRLTSLLQIQKLRAERSMPTIEIGRHLVFTGNPGTGKTTVARLLAQIYRSVGIVTVGQLVETDRSDLVAGFVGQTAPRTRAVLESALGGMLLIDEAYALARGGENDFGLEAIDTLVKFMEDHRDDLAVVAAGYPDEMGDLLAANPGLKSRFTRTIDFPDYTDDELIAIFDGLCRRNRYELSDDALERLRHLVSVEPRDRGFGNARFVRNLFEAAVSHQATRLAPLIDPSDEQLTFLVADDIAL